MTDDQVLEFAETSHELPRLTVGDRKYVHFRNAIVELQRVGKGERWSFGSRDVHAIGAPLPRWWGRDVTRWVSRLSVNWASHAGAMGTRTL